MSIYVNPELAKKLHRDYKLALEVVGFENEEDYVKTHKSRKWKYLIPRQIAIWLLIETGIYSTGLVGKIFLKDHATVVYTRKKINTFLEIRDPQYADFIEDCYERFRLMRKFSAEELGIDEKLQVIKDALNHGFTCKTFFGVNDLYSQARGFLISKEKENEQGNVG